MESVREERTACNGRMDGRAAMACGAVALGAMGKAAAARKTGTGRTAWSRAGIRRNEDWQTIWSGTGL